MSERTDVSMWQRFLDRFVPVLQDVPSVLDLADGVGRTVLPVHGDHRSPLPATARSLSAS
jgi:hypothetical protein